MIDFNKHVEYKGEMYHSATEAAYAAYWDLINFSYIHWPETFVFPSGRWYTPDFYLPEVDAYVEVKNGADISSGAILVSYLGLLTAKTAILVDGKPKNSTWYFFSPCSRTERYQLSCEKIHGEDLRITPLGWGVPISSSFIPYYKMMIEADSKATVVSDEAMRLSTKYLDKIHNNRTVLTPKEK